MNISSLIKVFGIAAAGFVPQAQANPFGISFVKVEPPKDKKEEASCFRLKLSQTDVFSEHNFTDITFRNDTTVFLQKNMVIGDEEEILKKTFKNFNAEKDPFEIPEKYLPLEDKDRTEWVDKDGKPLRFLVVVLCGKIERWSRGCLAISGASKQHAFYVQLGRWRYDMWDPYATAAFLDGITCVITDKVDGFRGTFKISGEKVDLDALLKNVGLIRKRKPHCIITREAFDNRLEALEDFKNTEVLFHTDGNCFQAFHTSLPGFSQAKLEAMKIATPHFVFGCGNICTVGGLCPHIGVGNTVHRDYILILVWKASEKNAEYSRVRISSDKGTYDANIVCKGEYVFSVNVLRDVTSLRVVNSFNGSNEEFGKAVHDGKTENNYKLYLPIYF